MRPVLKPALCRVWRNGTTLQLGLDPDVAVVFTDLGPGERAVLDLLDEARPVDDVLTEAVARGVARDDAVRFVSALEGAGVLDDASAPTGLAALPLGERRRLAPEIAALSLRSRRPGAAAAAVAARQQAVVAVIGAGRLGAPLAALLAAAGVGTVDVRDLGLTAPADVVPGGLLLTDVGRVRGQAARDAVRRSAASTVAGPAESPADLVVLAPAYDERDAVPAAPHLAVTAVDGIGIVGPLVLPGRSPCLRCLDLHRADRDPAWPALRRAGRADEGDGCDGPVAVATAALASMQALAFLDGAGVPSSVGATLELRPPDGRSRRRSWSMHPDCGCATRAPSPARRMRA